MIYKTQFNKTFPQTVISKNRPINCQSMSYAELTFFYSYLKNPTLFEFCLKMKPKTFSPPAKWGKL
jgi:hypothetical protein